MKVVTKILPLDLVGTLRDEEALRLALDFDVRARIDANVALARELILDLNGDHQ